MPSFFPALPQPAIVTNPAIFKQRENNQPIDAFVGGMGSGLALSKNLMGVQKQAHELEQEAATEEALKGFAQTGDVGPVLQANPKFGLALKKEERQAATDREKAEREMLVKAVEYADKVLPYFATDQDPGPERWNAFRQHMAKLGVGHLVGPTWSKENVQQLVELKKDYAGKLGLAERLELDRARSELRMNEFENKLLMREELRGGKGGGGRGGKGGGGADPAAVTGSLPAGMPPGLAAKLEKGGSTELFQRAWSLHKSGVQGTWPELIEEAQRGKVGVLNPKRERRLDQSIEAEDRKAAEAEAEVQNRYNSYKRRQEENKWPVMTVDEWKANGMPFKRPASAGQPARQPQQQPQPSPTPTPPGYRAMKDRNGNRVLVTEQQYQEWKARQAGQAGTR